MTTPATTQTPLTLGVTSGDPVRLGRNPEGSQKEIVNDAANRIWLGPDSNVATNRGLPVPGSTALLWTAVGDIWAIRDKNTDGSLGTGDVHYSDVSTGWQPSPVDIGVAVATQLILTGVAVVDNPKLLLDLSIPFSVPQTQYSSSESGLLDVSTYSSYSMQVSCSTQTPNIGHFDFEVWQYADDAGTLLMSRDRLTIASANNTITGTVPGWSTDTPAYSVSGAIRGRSLKVKFIALQAFNSGFAAVTIVGSRRPAPVLFKAVDVRAIENQIISINGSLAASGSVTYYPPMRPGRWQARCTCSGQQSNFAFSWPNQGQQFTVIGNVAAPVVQDVNAPRSACVLTITNQSGAGISNYGVLVNAEGD